MTGALHIALAAGGTGGHMAPADAVARALMARGYAVSLITDARGAAIPNMLQDVSRTVLPSASHQQGGLFGKVRSMLSLVRAVSTARHVFRKDRPAAVVGFGGYPSFPAVRASKALGIPYLLHEQNGVLGRVNRWCARGAGCLLLSLHETQRVPTGVIRRVTGNPVRREALKTSTIRLDTQADAGAPVKLLVVGGSQGARILSDNLPAAIGGLSDSIKARLNVTHQARPEDVERVKTAYADIGVDARVEPYFNDIPALMADSYFAICRAGASTIAELTAIGCPAILVPLAIAADDHQSANARILESAGAARVLAEAAFTADSVGALMTDWIENPEARHSAAMAARALSRPDAAERVADAVEDICKKPEVSA